MIAEYGCQLPVSFEGSGGFVITPPDALDLSGSCVLSPDSLPPDLQLELTIRRVGEYPDGFEFCFFGKLFCFDKKTILRRAVVGGCASFFVEWLVRRNIAAAQATYEAVFVNGNIPLSYFPATSMPVSAHDAVVCFSRTPRRCVVPPTLLDSQHRRELVLARLRELPVTSVVLKHPVMEPILQPEAVGLVEENFQTGLGGMICNATIAKAQKVYNLLFLPIGAIQNT